MSDRLFSKILDYSLLPIAFLVLGKTVGVFSVFSLLDIRWGIAEYSNSIISATPVILGKDLQAVSTYSNIFTFGIFILGLGIIALPILLSDSKISSKSIIKNILVTNFIGIKKDRSIRLFIWVIYMWLFELYLIIDVARGNTSPLFLAFSILLAGVVTSILQKYIVQAIGNPIDELRFDEAVSRQQRRQRNLF